MKRVTGGADLQGVYVTDRRTAFFVRAQKGHRPMKKNNTSSSVAADPAKAAKNAVNEAILALAESSGSKDLLLETIRKEDRLLCYRACLSYYRDHMQEEWEDDDECSDQPDEAKKIHAYAVPALNMLLANPELDPCDMVDLMPKTKIQNFYEKDFANDLFMFLGTIHNILFPKLQEA